jgi:hypothetical protein
MLHRYSLLTGAHGRLRAEPGRVTVLAGTSSDDLPCRAEIEIVGDAVALPKRRRYFTAVAVD